jgi:peptidoglycan hydrolase FlgJ
LLELEIFMTLTDIGTLPVGQSPAGATPAPLQNQDSRLMEAAKKLEAGFLAEMLRSAGLGASRGEFGGGAGEDHFSSFLVEQQAQQMVEAGGIGLAQSLFEAMKARDIAGQP